MEADPSKALLDVEKGNKGYGSVADDVSVDSDHLRTGTKGLSAAEASDRLKIFGYNELPQKADNKLVKLLLEFVQPMPIIIWLAICIEMVEYFVAGTKSALMDGLVLFVLQVLNVAIGFIEELKASEEVAALRASLKPEAVVIRDGVSQNINATLLVPGDRLILASGAAVPADCVMCEDEKPIQVDQSAMTGESLPVTMQSGSHVKMGSTVVYGESQAIVHQTGSNTFIGTTALLINTVTDEPHFEKVLQSLLITLVGLGSTVCSIIFIYLHFQGEPLLEVLAFCSVLLIASIPVALRVVCTCTLALGCKELAAEKAIVARLSAIEEFAGMDILCADKTGTLTLNTMVLQEDAPIFDSKNVNRKDLLQLAALAGKWWEPPKDALDTLVFGGVDCKALTDNGYVQLDYTPFNPETKRTEAKVRTPERKIIRVMKGAPDVLLRLSDGNSEKIKEDVETQVNELARRGIRALAVASGEETGPLFFLGMLTFLDPPRPDTKATIEQARRLGVSVKMITGDHMAIAAETARTLGMGDAVEGAENLPQLSVAELDKGMKDLGDKYGDRFLGIDCFAQVFPAHKYLIVEALRQKGHLVGMTGDGVNDAPALKRADVGISVSGATDAAQAASDIVLTQPGLSTIITTLFTSRRIFQRMKNFVVYRVACTAQLLFFFFFSCLLFKPVEYDAGFVARFFTIPVIALVFITILNDGTIISVAYDKVDASTLPAQWNLPSLYFVSTAIGATALISSLILLNMALKCTDPHSMWHIVGLPKLEYDQIQTVMYMKISLSDYVSVFNSRCQGWMWSRAPSFIVTGSAAFAMILTSISAMYFPMGMGRISWQVMVFVWIYITVWALIQDVVKVAAYDGLRRMGAVREEAACDEQDLKRSHFRRRPSL